MTTQRDTFISELFERAQKDKDIYLVTVDMGAPSLDRWRSDLPGQFLSAGISEQHAVNFAAGMASEGKKVYVYFMAAWVARCFEQIRYSCAMAENPITVLGNGIALGYAPAGPAHEPNEDMAYMRSLCNIEIYSPCNNNVVKSLVDLTIDNPKLRYLRLERKYATELDSLYQGMTQEELESGIATIKQVSPTDTSRGKVCVLSSGYMLGRCSELVTRLGDDGYEASLVDMWKIKPVDANLLEKHVKDYDTLVTVEEQTLSGGFGSCVCETLADLQIQKPVLRIGLPDRYIFENGSRDYHIDNNGLSVDSLHEKVTKFLRNR